MLKLEFFRQALPHLYYWSSSQEDGYAEIMQQHSDDALLMKLAACVLDYTNRLKENSSDYNPPESCEEALTKLNELIEEIKTVSDQELLAAAYNLRGLYLHQIMKQIAAAKETYELALKLDNLPPLTRGSILTNLSSAYTYEDDHQKSYAMRVQILSNLDAFNADVTEYDEETQTVRDRVTAALYSRMALAMAKVKNDYAINFFDKAMDYWPESNVISNQAAIGLSKLNQKESIEMAETIFAKHYQSEVAKLRFVNPYYRADVNIKLAAYAALDNPETLSEYQPKIEEYLAAADNALNSLKADTQEYRYSEFYRTKSFARINYLRGQWSAVLGKAQEAEDYQKLSKEQRASITGQVDETPEKTLKFGQKFVPIEEIRGSLNPNWLFRRPSISQASETKIDDANYEPSYSM